MQPLTLFILPSCPFCQDALKYIKEAKLGQPELNKVDIAVIDESEQSQLADSYDYYYVPCFFNGRTKLHEGEITQREVKEILHNAME